MGFSEFSPLDKEIRFETLRVGQKKIAGTLKIYKFIDKDTGQFVFYSPSFETTGYGSTEEKALKMIKSSISDYFEYLTSLTPKKRDSELLKLGWKNTPLKNKEFSKAFIDISGELKNFNAVEDKVELITLTA